MKKFMLPVLLITIIGPSAYCNAEVIFQSKWDNPNSASFNQEDDGGVWHYAYVDGGNINLARVNTDQTSLGGPSAPPPGSGASYMLRETWVPDGNDCQVYMQANFAAQHQGLTDYYGGMWVYFQDGIEFIDSVKFFDFRTETQETGNGHLALFGLDHNALGCGSGSHTSYNTASDLCGYPAGQNLMVFRYLDGPGSVVSGNEYLWNYNDAPVFETNFNSSGQIIDEVGYTVNEPDRVVIEGGVWMAFIFHVKVHATDGQYEVWIKKGTDPLKQVLNWNRDTVWAQSDGPHNFYTMNGTGGVDHLQFNSYWNGWPSASGTRRMWFDNVIAATTYSEVEEYLMGSTTTPPAPPLPTAPALPLDFKKQ